MANGKIKINELPETALAKDSDIFIIENDTTTQKISLGSLINYIKEHEEIAAHFLKSSAVNSPNGVAPLDNSKKIPYANLPVGTTENTILDGAFGQALSDSLSFHSADTGNPHAVTKSQIGLSDVDNTADTAKPVSTLQQQAIDTAYAGSNAYTDAKIAELIDGAPSTLDTLGEIARALQEGDGISDALDAAIGTKASQAELDSHTENDTIHISAFERTKWNEITALISHIASKATAATLGHVKLSDTYTSTIAEGDAANGMGASQKAVADTYSSLSSRLSDSLGGMTFGVDEDGNYGYIKAGADSVTPFKKGGELIPLGGINPVSKSTINVKDKVTDWSKLTANNFFVNMGSFAVHGNVQNQGVTISLIKSYNNGILTIEPQYRNSDGNATPYIVFNNSNLGVYAYTGEL